MRPSGHHHELAVIKQLKRGGQGGLSSPSLPLFWTLNLSLEISFLTRPNSLLLSMSKSFALQNTLLLCTLPVKLFSVIALASHCGSVHSSLDCRGIRKVLVMMHDDVARVTNPLVCSILNWCSIHSYFFTQLSPVSRVTIPYYMRGIMCCVLKKTHSFQEINVDKAVATVHG